VSGLPVLAHVRVHGLLAVLLIGMVHSATTVHAAAAPDARRPYSSTEVLRAVHQVVGRSTAIELGSVRVPTPGSPSVAARVFEVPRSARRPYTLTAVVFVDPGVAYRIWRRSKTTYAWSGIAAARVLNVFVEATPPRAEFGVKGVPFQRPSAMVQLLARLLAQRKE